MLGAGNVKQHRSPKQVFITLLASFSLCFASGIRSTSAWAQDSGPNPSPLGVVQQVAPQGMSQKEWDKELEQCNELWAEMKRRAGLPADQNAQLPRISYNAIENCRDMTAPVRNQYNPSRPTYADPVLPVPVASPTPPSDQDSNTSNAAGNTLQGQANVSHSLPGPPIPLEINR